MRAVARRLREIDRHSRRVERNAFDRAIGAGFVLALVLAPVATWRMQRTVVDREREPLLLMRAFITLDDDRIRVQPVDPEQRGQVWRTVVPMADIELVRERARAGWPFATFEEISETRLEAELSPSCRESRRAEVLAAAAPIARASRLESPAESRTHLVSWVFSIAVWWILLSVATWIAVTPLRLGWYFFRRGRTIVRQRRIDRCLCPNCGYDAKHSVLVGRCPECGSEIYERPEIY
jgi:hypothetical protein